jgi:YHS domain-containing protein
MTTKPSTVIDPVCGMKVDRAIAEANGLTTEVEGRTYAFCRAGCMRSFLEGPDAYVGNDAHIAAAVAVAVAEPALMAGQATLLVIDEGMRRWYESCSCCLSEAYPEIKAQLDVERAAAARPPVDPGICEVAEAQP